MDFIVPGASGSLGGRPDLGKKPYRLNIRFRVPAGIGQGELLKARNRAMDLAIADLRKQDWDFSGRFRVTMTGPYSYVEPVTIYRPKRPNGNSSKKFRCPTRFAGSWATAPGNNADRRGAFRRPTRNRGCRPPS